MTNREKESILSTENKKGENKMEFYSMEQFEIMADAMEEVQDWLNFEADMETHPFDWAGERIQKKHQKEKGDKKMTINEIKERIEKLENQIFYEQMADFMNWNLYYKLTAEKRELENQLKEMEG